MLLYNGGYQIYSCLDSDIQEVVDSIYTDMSQMPQPYRQPAANADGTAAQFQSAIVIMDPYTGEIVALSGGTGEKTANFILLDRDITTCPPLDIAKARVVKTFVAGKCVYSAT